MLKKTLITLTILAALVFCVAQLNVSIRDLIGTSLPETCTVGQRYFKTDATAGRNLYGCTSSNTWTVLGDGSAASSNSYGAYASLPASCTAGDRYLTSDSIYEFACTASNTWRAFNTSTLHVIPPSAGWSWVNQGSATVTYSLGYGYLSAPASAADSLRMQTRSASAPYTVTARIRVKANDTQNYFAGGLMCRNSGSGEIINFGIAGNGGVKVISYYHSSPTGGGSMRGSAINLGIYSDLWLQLSDDNTNRILKYSINGTDWLQHSSTARTTDVTCDEVGWFSNSANSSLVDAMLLSWNVT